MKKKIFFTIVLIVLIISELSIIYADLIIPGQYYNSYSSGEKLGKFYNYMESPLKEVISILIILFESIGLILLTFRAIRDNEYSNFIHLLEKIFFGINIVLSLISIYLIKIMELFDIEFTSSTSINLLTPTYIIIYIIYTIIMFFASIISIKKRNKKIVYITTICLTFVILLICFITFNNISIGYYTYDNSSYNLFKINPLS